MLTFSVLCWSRPSLGQAGTARTDSSTTDPDSNARKVGASKSLAPIITTGTVHPLYIKDSPIKIEVITKAVLDRNITNSLPENLAFIPGLNQQIDCGVCFTNNIRINGMEGAYTAVLIDGTPMMSALSTVYGLNSIDPSLIEQIEIIKGPNSTLYGSEAMGGVINIVTKSVQFAPRLSIDSYTTSNGETSINMAGAPSIAGKRTLFSMMGSYNNRFVDRNGDNFSDLPLLKRFSAFNKWAFGTVAPIELSARYYYENRFGGTREWKRSDRGSSEVYGESIYTHRIELLGTYQRDIADAPFRLDAAFNWHEQDSFYGDSPYMATQTVAFAQAVWMPKLSDHRLGLGATLRHQGYRDSTSFHITRENRFIPGVMVQDEVVLNQQWTILAGLRADHHKVHGVIPSPSVAVRWRMDEHTTVRVNAATGFRVVNLFTEDHAALTGARAILIEGKLDPERSLNFTTSLNRMFDILEIADAISLDIDAYYTRFTNRILPDFDSDPNLIVYRNLDGTAETRGIAIAVGYATVLQPLSANLGLTIQDAFSTQQNERKSIPFSPRFQGVFTLAYKFPGRTVTVDWIGRVLGPMQLPVFEGYDSHSPWLTEQHVQVTKRLHSGASVYASIKNIFDYVQRDAIIDPGNPFGASFDTARVYGPLQGRRVLIGMRYTID